MTEEERLEKYLAVVPNERQLIVQEMKFYAFIHFGINTFTNREWGDGKESEMLFNPTDLDTDQWCKVVKNAGMKAIILTCKHHDGFCLWQTETTQHSIKNSPYKNGKGDIVAELAASCKKYGLKFGVYLSPWDRNAPCYGTAEYNDFYIDQLKELLSNYGEISILWLDGACGAASDGKKPTEYDFPRIYETALSLQPNIVLSDCAPDVRWIGNESGKTRESEWNVVPSFDFAKQTFAGQQQDSNMKKFQKKCKDVMIADLGSRDFLKDFDSFMWYPAEADVSIRQGWFYHKKEYFTVKSVKKLMQLYYQTVGNNALFLLNVPPTKKGLIAKKDARNLAKMGKWLKKEEELKVKNTNRTEAKGGFEITLSFPKTKVDRVYLSEDTTKSQRVEKFSLWANDKKIYSGTIIGFSKIAIFEKIKTDSITLKIEQCRKEPYIDAFDAVRAGGYR